MTASFFKKIIYFFFLLVLFISPIFVKNAESAITKEVNYQARLLDASGDPVTDGSYSVEFNLYTVVTGGVSLWTETQSVTVTNGLFSALLGSVTPLTSVDFNQTLYLGVDIEADGEMVPRKKLGSVTSAFVADTLDGISSEQFFRNDIVNATSSATTSLAVRQNGTGAIVDFIGSAGTSALRIASNGEVQLGTTSRVYIRNGNVEFQNTIKLGSLEANPEVIIGVLTGNTRGDEAIDIQTNRSSVSQVASGFRSIAIGTDSNVTSSYSIGIGHSVSSTGLYSSAFGYNTTASGNNSVSIGNNTIANSTNAVAVGSSGTMASGQDSSSFGSHSAATANYATALGYSNIAQSQFASAIGIDNLANGDGASAFGNSNDASGTESSAFGANNIANNFYSSAFGYGNNTSNTYASAFGSLNNASGNNASAFGSGNLSSGSLASAFGYSNFANSTGASAIGYDNDARGSFSTAVGYSNYSGISGLRNSLFGYNNTTNTNVDDAYVFGTNNIATVDNTGIFGANITNSTANSLELGPSNTAKVAIKSDGQVVGRYFTADSSGVASTFPKLSVTDFKLSGIFYDSLGVAGTDGFVLQTTSAGVEWVATSSLGFAGNADTLASLSCTASQFAQWNGSAWVCADASMSGQGGDKYAVLVDEKASNTWGGAVTSGSWVVRDLNTEKYDDIGVTISGNQFTLPAGTYEIDASAPAYYVNGHQARLYNVTDGVVVKNGTSEYSGNANPGGVSTFSRLKGIFTITDTKTFRIEHRVQTSRVINGLGAYSGSGASEIYTTVSLRKLGSGDGVFTASSSDAYITGGTISIGQTSGPNLLNVNGGIFIASTTPATTTNSLYNVGGTLYFNGSEIGTGGGGGQGGDKYAVLVDEKPAGTNAGDFTAGAWRTRDINTEQYDDIGITISSNEFTLPAGTYEINARAPAFAVDRHILRLYNVTDAAVHLTGGSHYARSLDFVSNDATLVGTFTIDEEKTFRLEHRSDVTKTINGLGVAVNLSVPEVYATIALRKLGSGDGVFTASSSDAYFTGGNIGIGTNVPTQLLHVRRNTDGVVARFQDSNGYCDINPTNTSLVCTSDERLKEAVRDLDDYNKISNRNASTSAAVYENEEVGHETTLDRLLKLRPVEFEWISDETDGKRYGFIAQEVEEIFPELVTTDEDSGYKSVAYGGFVPFVVQSIQELAAQQVALLADVADMKTKMSTILAQIEELATNTKAAVFGWMQFRDEKLCVDDVCINKEAFKELIKNNGGTTNNEFNNVSDSGSDTVISLDDEVVEVEVATTTEETTEQEDGTITSLDYDVITSGTDTTTTPEAVEPEEIEEISSVEVPTISEDVVEIEPAEVVEDATPVSVNDEV